MNSTILLGCCHSPGITITKTTAWVCYYLPYIHKEVFYFELPHLSYFLILQYFPDCPAKSVTTCFPVLTERAESSEREFLSKLLLEELDGVWICSALPSHDGGAGHHRAQGLEAACPAQQPWWEAGYALWQADVSWAQQGTLLCSAPHRHVTEHFRHVGNRCLLTKLGLYSKKQRKMILNVVICTWHKWPIQIHILNQPLKAGCAVSWSPNKS